VRRNLLSFKCQIWLNHLWNYQPELHDKKNLNAGRIAAWKNLLPIYLFFTGDSMKRIIGHTCAASAKVVWQMQLM
jgi:hypothetical protein